MTRNAKNRPNVLTLNCGPPDRGLRLSGAPLAAHPIMPVQVARRRANSRCGSRLGRQEKRGRTANFNGELGRCYSWPLGSDEASGGMTNLASFVIASEISFALLKVATPA